MREKLALFLAKGVGPETYRALLAKHGSPEAALSDPKAQAVDWERVERVLGLVERFGLKVVGFWEEGYPPQLAEIPQAPAVLFVWGSVEALSEDAIAVVGTRRPTQYGLRVARELGRECARRGYVLVSGGAYGVDAEAHRAALDAGGKTVAVLGGGHGHLYPRAHRRLFEEMVEAGGAVVSEYPPDVRPEAGLFPRRNRIISGLAKAVVVVEGSRDSGAMITARWALEQGREVYAVPGPIYSEKSEGPNWLISQGAHPYLGPESLFPSGPPPRERPELSEEERRLLDALGREPKHVDEIAEELGLGVPEALTTLLSLEIKGVVRSLPGKFFVKEV